MLNKIISFFEKPGFGYLFIFIIISSVYYKFFLLGQIPFPGDLLVNSYSPWFDTQKFPVQNPIISDVFSQTFIWKQLSINIFKIGQWPLWNPYSFTGTPLLATYQSAVFYPLNILLLLPQHYGWGIFILSQTMMAAITMYLFLSLLVSSKLARLTGAIIFSLSGLMATWLELGIAVHAMAWLPMCLYLVTKYSYTERIRFIFLFILSLFALILAGNAQITTYSLITIGLYSLVCTFRKKNIRQFLRQYIFISLAIIFSLILSSPQLLPALDLLPKSIRATDTYTGAFQYGLLTAKDIFRFFVADFTGNPVTRNYWGFMQYPETSGFTGSLTLPLILFAIFYLKKNKFSLFFLLLLFISILLAFNNPLSMAIYKTKIPLLTSSYASRILFITTFAISVLSALSLNQIIQNNLEKQLFKISIWSWSVLVGILLGTILVYQQLQIIFRSAPTEEILTFYLQEGDYALNNFIIAARNSLLPVAIVTIFVIALLLIRKINIRNLPLKKVQVAGIILFFLITLDLGRYFQKFNPFVDQRFIFPQTPGISYLQTQPGIYRIGREHGEILPPNTWAAYNIQSFEGYDPIYLSEYGKFINFLNGLDFYKDIPTRYAELSNTYTSPYLDAANVKYFIAILRTKDDYTPATPSKPGSLINYKFNEGKYKQVYSEGSFVVLENPQALERVYFPQNIIIASIDQAKSIMTKDKTFNPKTTVILDQDLGLTSVSGVSNASITKYTPNKVQIQATTDNNAILVLSDQYDDGWQATIDGNKTEISRANIVFRAIKIPAGNHEVVFYYWPKSFELGLKLFGAGTVALLCFLTFAIKKKIF